MLHAKLRLPFTRLVSVDTTKKKKSTLSLKLWCGAEPQMKNRTKSAKIHLMFIHKQICKCTRRTHLMPKCNCSFWCHYTAKTEIAIFQFMGGKLSNCQQYEITRTATVVTLRLPATASISMSCVDDWMAVIKQSIHSISDSVCGCHTLLHLCFLCVFAPLQNMLLLH